MYDILEQYTEYLTLIQIISIMINLVRILCYYFVPIMKSL